jgi:putative ABC transport system permease protein
MDERAYRRLLRLLPPRFRDDAEAELLETFRTLHARAQARGRLALGRFWVRMLVDVLVTSFAEHGFDARAARRRRRPADHRASSIVQLIGGAGRDLRLAIRRLGRMPAPAFTSGGTLALGLATSIVSAILVRDVLLRPLPFPQPGELVRILEVSEGGRRWWPSFPNAADWRQHASFFRGVGIADIPSVRPVLVDGAAVRVPVSRAARGFFETLGVRPAAGRLFAADENRPGGRAAAIVSDRFWRSVLAARPPGALDVTIGLEHYAVVGVLPADFRFLGDGAAWTDPAAIWTPMDRDAGLGQRTSHGYHVVARLAPGVTLDRARADMNALARTLKAQHGEPTQADGASLTPLVDVVTRSARDPLMLLLVASGVVLLVTCFNLAAVVLAHGLTRTRELSVRLALGATRATLVRHLLAETATLAVPGAVMGLVGAGLGLGAIRTAAAGGLPRLDTAALDLAAVALAFGVALLTACLAGIIPALALSRRRTLERLRVQSATTGPRDERRVWLGLVGVQVTLTVVLLAGTGLLLRSFRAALDVDLGYDARRVLAVDLTLPESRYGEPARRVAFYDAALERLRSTPGIAAAGLTSVLPHLTSALTAGTSRGEDGDARLFAGYRVVDAGYFDAIGIVRLRGSRDALRSGQALVDGRLQRQLWSGRDPIGDRVVNSFSDRVLTVGGVVGTVREWQQGEETTGAVYVDYHFRPDLLQSMSFVVRYAEGEGAAIDRIRRALAAVDSLVPVTIEPLDRRTAESLAGRRLLLTLAGGFAVVALLLSTSGVYAMAAFTTARRRREAAIRLALGAHPSSLGRRVILQAIVPASAGILAGVALAIPVGRAMQAQLFHVRPADPVVLGAAALAVAVAALAAAIAPARRAARVDAAVALRQD